jgi:hypothetical protein
MRRWSATVIFNNNPVETVARVPFKLCVCTCVVCVCVCVSVCLCVCVLSVCVCVYLRVGGGVGVDVDVDGCASTEWISSGALPTTGVVGTQKH